MANAESCLPAPLVPTLLMMAPTAIADTATAATARLWYSFLSCHPLCARVLCAARFRAVSKRLGAIFPDFTQLQIFRI